MEKKTTNATLLWTTAVFLGTPLLVYALGDVPRRSLLKEGISLLSLMAIFQMVGQFYTTRCNKELMRKDTIRLIQKTHKCMGYGFIAILFVHPFLIVFPRYFEAGVAPADAFITILTTNTLGVITGIIAWCLMVILAVTSLYRLRLPMSYRTWRFVHGILSLCFILFGAWHAISIGRHSTSLFAFTLIFGATGGLFLFLRSYFPAKKVAQGANI